MKGKERCLGFYSLSETQQKDGYLGAVLVTDLQGRPLEFHVTYPVKPTAFQKPLYGTTLVPYIGVDLCGKQLLQHLDHQVDVLVVSQQFLLDVRDLVSYPVVHLQKAGDVIDVKSADGGQQKWSTEQVASRSGRYQPINIRTAAEHADDLARSRDLIEEAFQSVDLVEPFGRITQALELLAKEDKRFT